MSAGRAATLVAVALVLAGAFVWWMNGSDGARSPGPAPGRDVVALQLPPLAGAVADRAVRLVVEQLVACQHPLAGEVCRGEPMLSFSVQVHKGIGSVQDLIVTPPGSFVPALEECFRPAFEEVRFAVDSPDGRVQVRYPVACDGAGRVWSRLPVPEHRLEKTLLVPAADAGPAAPAAAPQPPQSQ